MALVIDPPEPRQLVAQPLSKLPMEPTYWLWEHIIPEREITLVGGNPGVGKSQFASWLTAQITRGALPGDNHQEPGGVLYLTTEDDYHSTVVPRLKAAGADLAKVYRLRMDKHVKSSRVFYMDLQVDMAELRRIVKENDIRLLVLDPIVSIAGGRDINKADDIRPMLESLKAEVLEPLNVSAVGLIHLRKAASSGLLEKIAYSGAWVQVARAVIGIAADDEASEETGVRTFVASLEKASKGSLSALRQRFTIEGVSYEAPEGHTRDIETSRMVWGEESSSSAEDLLIRRDTGRSAPKKEQCADWLRAHLDTHGPTQAGEVLAAAEKAGYKKDTLYKAAKKINVHDRYEGRTKIWAL